MSYEISEETRMVRKACADSGHAKGGGLLGSVCIPCNYLTLHDLRTSNAALTLALAESHRVLRGALRCVTECGCGACQRNIKTILATTPAPEGKPCKMCNGDGWYRNETGSDVSCPKCRIVTTPPQGGV